MMATLIVDTYRFIEKLRASGIAESQAKAIVEGIQELDFSHMATKGDLAELKAEMFKWLIPLMLGQYGLLLALLMKAGH
jgi:hypothetical protein